MEKVYGCGDLDFTSESICLREFFKDATLTSQPFRSGPVAFTGRTANQKESAYREKMMDVLDTNLTDSEFLDLENICSADNFKSPETNLNQVGDRHWNLFIRTEIPTDSDLETHRKLKRRSRIHERFLKYAGTVWLDKSKLVCNPKNESKFQDIDLVPGSELVAVVRLYAPFRHQVGERSGRIATGSQEITVLGTQTLAELRDVFACSSDNIVCEDLSSNPLSKTKNYAKTQYKSGMMYIGNTFYDDKRNSTNLEYSETVLTWAKQRGLVLGGQAKMEDTKILDLTVKLGYPYLYQHQGNCEHLFCFSDIRLLHQSDPLQSSRYPLLRCITRQHSRHCMLCGHYIAKWLTVGNTRVPHDPCYFCQTCFLSYNYVKKRKIGSFRAYPFSDSFPEVILK